MQNRQAVKTAVWVLLLVTLPPVLRWSAPSHAFHDGGVGACDACHTIHGPDSQNPYLLKGQNPSSLCLNCHEHAGDTGPTGAHVSTPGVEIGPGVAPRQLSPGGDFGWLKKTFYWVPGAGQPLQSSLGERHGHNIIAPDFLYLPDSTNSSAPGGSYPASDLTCVSCHEPHGGYRRNVDGSITRDGRPISSSGSFAGSPDPNPGLSVGVYRLLGGKAYQPPSVQGSYAFINDPPAAVAPDTSNRSEAVTQTRVAYGAGMSEWCRNCHANIHTPAVPGGTIGSHPVGSSAKFGAAQADYYNAYVRTGDLTGTSATSYLSLVPFEEGTANYAQLKTHAVSDNSYLAGPDAIGSQVMCLTCHRAHASGWDSATRWNARTDQITSGSLYSQEGQAYQPYGQGRTEAEALRAYYDLPSGRFATNQDSLCNKCHGGVYP
jgi:predicted CXXCH cytochrome family protein